MAGSRKDSYALAEESVAGLREKIKSGNISGVYAFSGDDLYRMDEFSKVLEKSAGGEIDIHCFQGRLDYGDFYDDFNGVAVFEAMNTASMFDDAPQKKVKKLKITKVENPDFGDFTEAQAQDFCNLIADTGKSEILIFYNATKKSKESKIHDLIIKSINETAFCVEFVHPKSNDSRFISWAKKQFLQNGIDFDGDILQYMYSQIGNDMYTLFHEIQKLAAYVKMQNKTKPTRADVDAACIKNSASVDFALSNAVLSGDAGSALRELAYARDHKQAALISFGSIAGAVNTFCRISACKRKGMLPKEIADKTGIHPYVVSRNLSAASSRFPGKRENEFCRFASQKCLECDRALKNFSGDDFRLLEILILEICGF